MTPADIAAGLHNLFWAAWGIVLGWHLRGYQQSKTDRDGMRMVGQKIANAARSALETKRFVGDCRVISESRLTLPEGRTFKVLIEEDRP